jgi:phage major head subunit gpT-like protein
MELTTSQLQSFFTQLDLSQQRGYQKVAQYWNKFSMLSTSGTERKTYAWLAQLPSMKKWIGEKQLNNIAARSFEVTNDDFENTFGVDRNKLDDDQFGVYSQAADLQGQAVARWPDEQMTAKLIAGTTTTCYDGQFFFDTDHPVDLDDSSQGTYANLRTSKPLTLANYASAKSAMRSFKGESGRPLQVKPTVMMVGPDNELNALNIIKASSINQVTQNVAATDNVAASAPENVYKGDVELVVNEYLIDDTAGAWYLFSTDRIEPLIWQVRKQPTRIPIVDPTNPLVWNNRTFAYSVEGRAGAGFGLPFLAIKNTP